jgi:acyl-CoA thioester hydrolase
LDALPLYSVHILPEWIDFNGHLRDAYYGLALSYAVDAVMDQLGMDRGYRERTRCTLYTLELHMHYRHEVKASDPLAVQTSILAADTKRIHMGCRFLRGPSAAAEVAATGDLMLLHVHQGVKPASAAFPPDILGRLQSLALAPDVSAAWGPRSRAIDLNRRAFA